ncbi:MAG: hypothetical protein AMJ54_03415 [Deltaproteobacteria bacterium SG8_13]|nr:MAG: hypothetical protein AMJ54_03415 [Deltaproteobacteria bacterium SG8_13]
MMRWWKRKEKELKTVWAIHKGHRRVAYLVGTAHFFPYSFRDSFRQLIGEASAALFEGPLDGQSLQAIRSSGIAGKPAESVLDKLDRQTRTKISDKLFPGCRRRTLEDAIRFSVPGVADPLHETIAGMKPWLSFFTLWSAYLERCGWHHSVDLEAYRTAREMNREVVAMESVEEQVAVLEGLSVERIVGFLQRVDQWDTYRKNYVRHYLAADMGKIRASATGFPSRHRSVIDQRDETFFQRMRPYLDAEIAVVCVGAPHVPGICGLLQMDGFRIEGPALPALQAPSP